MELTNKTWEIILPGSVLKPADYIASHCACIHILLGKQLQFNYAPFW